MGEAEAQAVAVREEEMLPEAETQAQGVAEGVSVALPVSEGVRLAEGHLLPEAVEEGQPLGVPEAHCVEDKVAVRLSVLELQELGVAEGVEEMQADCESVS